MKIISIMNNKGGVGKTSSVQNVGACLARQGKRVLLIDIDAQANLTTSFGIDKYDVVNDSGDFCLGEFTFEQIALQAEGPRGYGIALIPASDNLMKKERILQGENMYQNYLRKRLRPLADQFDYCLIDCPPALGTLTVNALYASTHFFVPLQAEYLAYEGIRSILNFTGEISEDTGLVFGGVFATRYNPRERRKLSRDLIATTAEQLGDKYMQDAYIRVSTVISEAQSAGQDVFVYAPNSNAAHDYQELTREIIQRTT